MLSSGAAQAAEECLAAPNAQPDQTRHWYYRIDRVSQRKCWYLGPAGAKLRIAPQKVQPQKAQTSPRPIVQANEGAPPKVAAPATTERLEPPVRWPDPPKLIETNAAARPIAPAPEPVGEHEAGELPVTSLAGEPPAQVHVLNVTEPSTDSPPAAPSVNPEHMLALAAAVLALLFIGLIIWGPKLSLRTKSRVDEILAAKIEPASARRSSGLARVADDHTQHRVRFGHAQPRSGQIAPDDERASPPRRRAAAGRA